MLRRSLSSLKPAEESNNSQTNKTHGGHAEPNKYSSYKHNREMSCVLCDLDWGFLQRSWIYGNYFNESKDIFFFCALIKWIFFTHHAYHVHWFVVTKAILWSFKTLIYSNAALSANSPVAQISLHFLITSCRRWNSDTIHCGGISNCSLILTMYLAIILWYAPLLCHNPIIHFYGDNL